MPEPRPRTTSVPARRRRRIRDLRPRWWMPVAAVAAIAVVAGGIIAIERFTAPGPGPGAPATDADATPVCGFGGSLIDRLVADRPEGQDAPAMDTWSVDGEGELSGIAVNADSVVVGRSLEDGRSRFLRYSLDGRPLGSFTVGIKHEGRWTLADDGSLYLVDSYDGSSRGIVHLSADGRRLGSFEVPSSSETTDRWFDLTSIQWLPDFRGSPALLVGEGEHTVHVLGSDGQDRGAAEDIGSVLVGRVGDDGVASTTTRSGTTALDVVSASGTHRLHAVYSSTPDTGDPDEDPSRVGVPATPAPATIDGVVAGPDGSGFLVAGRDGIRWMDRLGVQKAVLLAGQNALSGSVSAGLAEHDGRYWMLIDDTEKGDQRVARLSSRDMVARLEEPLTGTADVASSLAQLGLGIGPVTAVPFNHFDAGTSPAVSLRAEIGWGRLPGVSRSELTARYTVRGDPTLADPVVQSVRTAAIPWGGGETQLGLPGTRPGAYEVSLELVDPSSGRVLSGSCLRYSVGAEGAALDLGSLAAGDDWGGAAPLRGAQLSAALGVGSHRIQLDFGRLVSDPTSSPDPAAIDWGALPGADGSDDPWQDIRDASAYATTHDVRLVVQVGSGGDAEKSAVGAGTWSGWVREIVAAFSAEAPGITAWSAWNEPNNSSGLSASDYWRKVEIPFADAAHAAEPGAFVIGGNTLGFADDWWQEARTARVCAHVDAIGVHPYTGYNRSWEEDGAERPDAGYARLAEVLGSDCDALPRWDTESGWTADGTIAYWNQGSNVARKLLWYERERIAGWTYFFSEGGFGESGLSWSLIQYRSYVKPGGLAFAMVSRMLEGRGRPAIVDTGIPFVHAMRVPGDDTMLVAWTDEARLDATLSTSASAVTATDEYGATDEVPLSGRTADVTLTAAPRFFRATAGSTLILQAPTPFGKDLLEGREVTASSTFKDSDPQTITSGTADPDQPWRSGTVAGGDDPHPRVTIPLASPTTIDRIAVATSNIACCDAGLRGYTVSVQKPDGSWRVVARPENRFWERTEVFRFDPVEATAVRVAANWTRIRGVRVLDMNYTGYAGGPPPPFIGLQAKTDYVMTVSAVSAWARGSG